jgi:hypothetical protein
VESELERTKGGNKDEIDEEGGDLRGFASGSHDIVYGFRDGLRMIINRKKGLVMSLAARGR